MANTHVRVRVQARDGKILGPAVIKPLLSVRNVLTGETLISDAPMNNQSSGVVSATATTPVSPLPFSADDSRNAIVVEPSPPGLNSPTYPTPGPYWLQTTGAGELIVPLQIDQPSLLEFKAIAFAPDPVSASATMWVLPGMQLLAEPGLVLTIAGLHATVTASASNGMAHITANVTMMCGCPITKQPTQTLPANTEPYWPSTEFTVTAQLRPNNGQPPESVPMTCTGTNTFTGSRPVSPGWFEVWLVAVQEKETNVGFARTVLHVT